jgi:hypothetical protein
MKQHIISQTQLEWINTMIGETKWNFLGLKKLPELKRLSSDELWDLWQVPRGTPITFANDIMDKLGVPNA